MNGTNHGTIVNLYQMAKMLDEEYASIAIKDAVEDVRVAILDSYNRNVDRKKNETFYEYLNRKRQWMAGMLGRYEYA